MSTEPTWSDTRKFDGKLYKLEAKRSSKLMAKATKGSLYRTHPKLKIRITKYIDRNGHVGYALWSR